MLSVEHPVRTSRHCHLSGPVDIGKIFCFAIPMVVEDEKDDGERERFHLRSKVPPAHPSNNDRPALFITTLNTL